MDFEHIRHDEAADAEHDPDLWNPWNLPSAVPVPTPTLDEWPEREVPFEESLAREGKPEP